MGIRSGIVAVLALALAGCGGGKDDGKMQGSGASGTTAAKESGGTKPATDAGADRKDQDTPAAPRAGEEAQDMDPAITSIQKQIDALAVDKSDPTWKTKLAQPAKATFTPGKSYFWNLKTNKGDIKIKLMPDVAPMHVTSTIYLTLLGFYDGLTFHRVLKGFMAQGGDPLGNGRGSPGYSYAGEFSPAVRHDRPGLLSMANAGPKTDGSQFFITFVPTRGLDDKHTIFGEVVAGMETVKAIEAAGVTRDGMPLPERLAIEKATVTVE